VEVREPTGDTALEPARGAALDPVTGLRERGRVATFDLARGLSVMFMIEVHVLWHWGAPDSWTTPIGTVISLLGGPTAMPAFMFLMGASLAFSRLSGFRALLFRGLWLFLLGYLLNVLRGFLPATIGLSIGFVTQDQINPFTPWWLLTTVDVHHMAGLSLVVIALLGLLARPGWAWLGLGVAVTLVAPLARGFHTGIPLLDGPLTPILGDAPNVYYAVLPWLVYPLTGGVFGAIIDRSTDRARVFRRAGLLGVALCVIAGVLFTLDPPTFDVATYWRQPPSFVVGVMGVVLIWLAACDLVVRHVRDNLAFRVIDGWSGRVIAMYFTHWLIVGWGIAIVGFRDQPLAVTLPLIVLVIAVTTWATQPRERLALLGWVHSPWAMLERRAARLAVAPAATLEPEVVSSSS
jgi:uncharacterized membrane protein